ncbi:MAG: hypothetical protein MK213_03030 [Planctomycetes bacterium]|nr:hypothetical protein [Planctomycetota bacterium]
MAAKKRRPTKASKKPAKKHPKKAAKAAVEGPAKPGMPAESAIVIVTTMLLIAAILLVKYEAGLHYGEGMFADKYTASAQ